MSGIGKVKFCFEKQPFSSTVHYNIKIVCQDLYSVGVSARGAKIV